MKCEQCDGTGDVFKAGGVNCLECGGSGTVRAKKLPARWVVRVVCPGGVGWLRHSSVPGTGPIVRFTSKRDAEASADMIRPGLDEGSTVSVVRVGRPKAGETK